MRLRGMFQVGARGTGKNNACFFRRRCRCVRAYTGALKYSVVVRRRVRVATPLLPPPRFFFRLSVCRARIQHTAHSSSSAYLAPLMWEAGSKDVHMSPTRCVVRWTHTFFSLVSVESWWVEGERCICPLFSSAAGISCAQDSTPTSFLC